MTAYSAIDLSQLPAPSVIEALDFETILAEMLADLRARHPAYTAIVESDPAYKILEVAAFRELLIRQRVNDGARAVMLAYAKGSDLDHIGANYDVERLMIDPGAPDAVPPVPPTYESDEEFRRRIQLSPEGYTTAGSEGSYVFHALGAAGDVKDAQAISPIPGHVTVYVLSRTGDGTAPAGLLNAVDRALNKEFVRPMTDNVAVQSATIVNYAVAAKLVMYPGPDSEVVRQNAVAALQRYVDGVHRIGYDVTLSGIYAALHQPGVQRVNLASPAANIIIDDGEASYCTSITVTAAGAADV